MAIELDKRVVLFGTREFDQEKRECLHVVL
jgi:hypothetical protein